MGNDIRHRQDHIKFLEDYISELTRQIDELTGDGDIIKEIQSLEYRLDILKQANGKFPSRIEEIEKDLKILKARWDEVEPLIRQLEEERSYYRCIQQQL